MSVQLLPLPTKDHDRNSSIPSHISTLRPIIINLIPTVMAMSRVALTCLRYRHGVSESTNSAISNIFIPWKRHYA